MFRPKVLASVQDLQVKNNKSIGVCTDTSIKDTIQDDRDRGQLTQMVLISCVIN